MNTTIKQTQTTPPSEVPNKEPHKPNNTMTLNTPAPDEEPPNDTGAADTTPSAQENTSSEAALPKQGKDTSPPGEVKPPGPVDIQSLRLSEAEISAEPSRLVRTEIVVGRPPKDQFFRVNPDPSCWGTFGILELDSDREVYLVTPEIRAVLLSANETCLKVATLCVSATRHGAPYLWPLKHSDTKWSDSSREIAKMATEQWLRLKSDRQAGYYVADVAADQATVPTFPEESFEQLLERGFRNRIIADHDHEVLRQLRGEE